METRLIDSQRSPQPAFLFLPALIASSVISAAVPFSAQAAPAGGSWYPGDGGVVLYQEAVPEPVTEEWVDPAASNGYVEPAPVEPLLDPTMRKVGGDETASGSWVEPAPVAAVPVDPAPSIAPAPVDASMSGATEPWGQPVATAYITGTSGEGAACHVAPEHATGTLALLGEGQPVEVRGEAVGEWQPVNCAGAGGYVHTSLLSWTPMPVPAVVGVGGQQELATGASAAGGEQIVSFAMEFQGYPYIYAGEGPYAFDCSGFTMFVINNTLGTPIPHDMVVQYEMGQQVSREALQPGDLVFFANTFRPGMSHNGIYIGGGQFIHAEREASGVTISDLNSDYYSSRWYGAVRFP
ncbi:MAG: C40 family peptidase [Chloroflexi bacterium]|nr:C40 family peptidase [Chloroflexota bacterium]